MYHGSTFSFRQLFLRFNKQFQFSLMFDFVTKNKTNFSLVTGIRMRMLNGVECI